ncbi:MAG: glycosyltransferase family 4 protein [Planctomycetota bacterium]|jgi:glycosyltransferase involved in cell wall biosynthesis
MTTRILHIIDHLHHGGAQTVLKDLIENTSDNKFEHFICVLRADKIEISIDTDIIGLTYKRWDPRTMWRIVKICKENEINILHAHLQKSIISSLLAKLFCDRSLIVHVHGGVFLKGLSFSLYRFLLRILKRKATIYIANSHATSQKLIDRINIKSEHIKILYNPIDFTTFTFQPDVRRQVRDELECSQDDIIIGFVGRLHHVKGVDLLIQAFALLSENNKDYFLVITGDGPERASLENLVEKFEISKRVRFLGMCPDVARVMSGFDIGVIPSRNEPFGRVALELMRMRVPIVSSGVDGLSELVKDGITGVVNPTNTPEQIAKAIQKLIFDGQLKQLVVENAYKFSEQFEVGSYVQKIQQIYQELPS